MSAALAKLATNDVSRRHDLEAELRILLLAIEAQRATEEAALGWVRQRGRE